MIDYMLRPNQKRSRNAIFMIWVFTLLYAIPIFFEGFEYLYVDEYDESLGTIIFYLLWGLFSFLAIIAMILSAVTFIMWFRRAYYNLHQKVTGLSYTDGWAASSWFIPLANLFVPYAIMRDLYTRTNVLLEQSDSPKLRLSNVKIWWGLWIISGIVEWTSFKASMNDLIEISLTLSVIALMLTLPLAIITIKVIENYSVSESELMN